MKKFMIAILFLIPLIIVLTVNVSGMIISATVKISVERIILKNRGEFINDVYINFNEYDANKYYKIDTVCYPKLAQVNLGWSTSDPSVAYVDEGKVYFVGYGDVTITAFSNENININARCNFYISGDTIYSINIIEYGNINTENIINLPLASRKLLDKIIVPANALKDKIITWSSSDNNIATVDDNGVIIGNSLGFCDITITVMEEEKEIKDSIRVNIVPSSEILNEDRIYFSGNTVNISEFTSDINYIVSIKSGEGLLNDKVLTYTGSGVGEVILDLNYNGVMSDLSVNFTDGDYLLGYKNLDILQKTKWAEGNIIWAGSANTVLMPVVLNEDYEGEMPEINWTSSDLNIVSVEEGRLFALAGGIVDIIISAEGFIDGVLSMEVISPMESVSLALDKSDDIKGIEGIRVFGIKSYYYDNNKAGYIDNTLKLKVNSYRPADAEQIYDYRSSNNDYATVDENGIITFYEAGVNKNVYIYITARYSISARPVSDYYEFRLVDGVNIGLEVNPSENTDTSPDFNAYKAMKEILENSVNPESAVMQCDVYVPVNGVCYSLHGNIYGNGYKYDAQFCSKQYGSNLFNINYNYFLNELFIRNLTIDSSYPTDDFMVYKNNGGIPISITCNKEEAVGKKFILKYCIMQYAFSHFYIYGGNIEIEGSILRNCAGPTMTASTEKNCVSNITIKNCIFSNIIAPIIVMATNFNPSNLTEAIDTYGSLTLLGNNYIYNWKEVQDVRADIIPSGTLPGNLTDIVNNKINDTMKVELKGDKYASVKIEAKDPITGLKKSYVNFSILIVGIWRDASPFNLNYDSSAYENYEIDVASTDIGKLLGKNLNYPCYLLTPSNNLTVPNETYELNDVTLRRLRG